jgi:hypothetical protein
MIFNILSKKLLKAAWVACNTLFFARLIQCKKSLLYFRSYSAQSVCQRYTQL